MNQNAESVARAIAKDETELKLRSLTFKRWLRTDEVALYLGASKMAIKHMVLRGKIHATKFCGRLYYDREELDRLIQGAGVKTRG
jgi:excisionase family DNA binding protein